MKEFLNIFQKFIPCHSPYDVWRDFIVLSSCAISNSLDKTNCSKRESLYIQTIKKYIKQEQELFPQLLAETVNQLENNLEQDFLGEIFMNLKFGDSHFGQYFTPYYVSKLMSKTIVGDAVAQVKEKNFITISDPCCGSGSLLIASVNEAKQQLEKENINFQKCVFVCGQDINQTVALMCYIQLSLMGVSGYILVGDALQSQNVIVENCWFTPMYFLLKGDERIRELEKS